MLSHSKAYWLAAVAQYLVWMTFALLTHLHFWSAILFLLLVAVSSHMGQILERENVKKEQARAVIEEPGMR